MRRFIDAAEVILREKKRSLHYDKITKIAIEKNLIETSGSTPDQTMLARIYDDIKKNKNKSVFKKVKPGIFKINPEYTKPKMVLKELEQTIEKELEEEEAEKIDSKYIGNAGEYRVISELLFRGYNASKVNVDEGVDIICTKNNRVFNIQVKTSNKNKFNQYSFNLKKASFKKFSNKDGFYIFMLFDKNAKFIILSNTEMEKNIAENHIREFGKKKWYRVSISVRGDKIYLGTLDNDISFFHNRWNMIK